MPSLSVDGIYYVPPRIPNMAVYRISAVTIRVRDMARSCEFYSRLPGFTLAHGGAADSFSSFESGQGSKMYLNLELSSETAARDFGRVIFHVVDVDALYRHIKSDDFLSSTATLEGEPRDAAWGERFFHVRDPDGYQLSFARPL